MRVDGYTKGMLTIIASCLLWISFVLAFSMDLVPAAVAADKTVKEKEPLRVVVVGINTESQIPIPVSLESPVDVVSVKGREQRALAVKIVEP